ncbi:MAG TPA: hypothetical protein VNW92_21665 [Polyangiaceae bacterium]|nr:hypothetical protein [Polyangiaceae bacterium]
MKAPHGSLLTCALAVSVCAACAPCPCPAPSSAASGYQAPRYASGKFSVTSEHGRAWFIAPDGQRFLSQGVNAMGDGSYNAPNPNFYDPVNKQFHGDKSAWVASAFQRLSSWGFNTVGAWSDDALNGQRYPYTYMLYAAGFDQPLEHVFEPYFETRVAANTEKARARKDDPYLIGYFLDNELPWWGEFGWHAGGQKTLLEKYAHAEVGGAGKRVLREFLERRYGHDLARFNQAYRTTLKSFDELEQSIDLPVRGAALRRDADDFAGAVAERFFAVTTKALRERDPNHLILCVRFAGEAPWPVVEVAGKYCDVLSVNQYQRTGEVDQHLLDDFYVKSKKPILITEYSFSATENQSGDPNTKGASVTVPTQQERAEHTMRFASQALALPYVVGLHWFAWADESPQGRFDGEDQDYGLVDIRDRPYALVTAAHAELNRSAQSIHARSTSPLPTAFQGGHEAQLHQGQPPKTLSGPLSFFQPGEHAQIVTWGDAPNGGNAKVESSPGAALIQYDSGGGWGAGVSVLPAQSPFDASGAAALEISLEVPAGRSVQIFLSEAGVAAPGSAHYDGRAGSDGESYEFPPLLGTGKRETYRIDLHDLERRSSWGNQRGNEELDLQALSAVDLDIPGKQGTGEIRVFSIAFEPAKN